MYTVLAYKTDHYDKSEYKEFYDLRKMWNWCKEFLSPGNRCVVIHRLEKRYKCGGWGLESRNL